MLKDKKIILYSLPTCGMCMALKAMLKSKNIDYVSVMDTDELEKNGISHVPVMEVDGERYDFRKAMELIKSEE